MAPMRSFHIAIGTIVKLIDVAEVNEGFEFQRSAITVISACVLNTLVDIQVSALHFQMIQAACQKQFLDEVFMQAVLDRLPQIDGQPFRMKNIDHARIASCSAVRSLHSVIDDRPIRVPEVVVSLQDAMVGKVEVGNVLEIRKVV